MGVSLEGITGYKKKKRFINQYDALDKRLQKAVDKMLDDIGLDPYPYNSYNPEPVVGKKGVFSIRVNQGYRASFEYDPNDNSLIIFRNVAKHDELYARP